jgi:WD40 repeat protein
MTPDGENLIWAAGPRVTICGLAHDELKGSFEYQGSVRATTVTADGKHLVAQTAVNPTNSQYRVIDLTSMKEQFTIECSYCSQLYATPSGLYHLSYAKVQASAKTKHVLRNLSTGEERVFECDRIQIEGSVLSPDGNFLASSLSTGSRGSSRFLDLNTGRIVVKSGFIRCWGFTRDAQKAILESSDHTLVIADLGKLMLDNRSTESKEIVWPVAVTPDDRYAFVRARPNLTAWNLINRQEEFVLGYAHDWMVLSPDGRTVYSGTSVWDLNTRTQSYLASTGMNSSDSIYGMVIAADGTHAVAWATSDGVNACTVWSLQTRRVEQLLKFKDAWRCAVSPTGRRFAYLSRDQPSVTVWDIAGGREERVIQNTDAKLRLQALAFTHSGDRLLIAGERGNFGETCRLHVWDLDGDENGTALLEAEYPKPMGVVHRSSQEILVTTLDGKWAVTRSSNNDLMIWNLAQRRFERHIAGQCASLSLNQQHFAFASGSRVGIYDLEQAEIAVTFHIDHEVRGVSLTKDGKTLIAGDEAGNLHLLQLEAGI